MECGWSLRDAHDLGNYLSQFSGEVRERFWRGSGVV